MDKKMKLSRVIALVSIMFASCSNDELKEIYQGEEIAFTTQVGRSIETNLATLDGFYVYADAPGAPMFINGAIAEKEDGSKYTFENSYFWPQGVTSMKFWAYGPKDIIKKDQVSITTQSQILNDFTPAKEPKDQKDLVVAYKESNRDDLSAMSVPLTFHHALSQIVVKAKCPSDNKKVYIKGVWIVNIKETGSLKFNNDNSDVNYMEWFNSKGNAYYGKEFASGSNNKYVQLTSDPTPLLENGTDKNSLMLVPQKSDDKLVFEEDGTVKTQGTYILLLCRVEAEHQGEYHVDGTTGVEGGGFVQSSGDKHIHQLFPIVGDAFDENVYGYTCVPVDIDWKPGKKYVYNLEFCGHSSGAGIYPPELPTGLPDGVKVPPTDKKPGQPVLDYPISFSVTVDDWTKNTEDKDVSMN